MTISTRHANIDDAQALCSLSDQLGYEASVQDIHARLTKLISSTEHVVVVALREEAIVGWIHGFYTLRVESAPFVEIGGLVVDEDARRMGVGRILVDRLGDWARSKESQKLRVRCNVKREESHLFYQSLGFSNTKDQKIMDIELD